MKKLFVVLAVLVCVSLTQAQSKFLLGAGLNVNIPSGTFGDFAGTGIGGTVQGELKFTDNISGTATVGYISYGGKDFGFFKYTYSLIPVVAGVKYYMQPNFYLNGDLGLYSFSLDTETPGFGKASTSTSEFGIGLGAGYVIPISPKASLDFTGKYLIISDMNSLDFRAGVKFCL